MSAALTIECDDEVYPITIDELSSIANSRFTNDDSHGLQPWIVNIVLHRLDHDEALRAELDYPETGATVSNLLKELNIVTPY